MKAYRFTALGLATALAFGVTACADDPSDGPCMTPAGTYTTDVAFVFGDCDSDLIDRLLSVYPKDGTFASQACGAFRSSNKESGETCDVAVDVAGTASASGYSDGSMSVGVDCDGGYSCSAFFNIYWTQR